MANGSDPQYMGSEGSAPDGCLCDDGSPTHCNYKQGDGDGGWEGKGRRGVSTGQGFAPDGCLCDAATPTFCWYKQGDGERGGGQRERMRVNEDFRYTCCVCVHIWSVAESWRMKK